MSAPAARPIRLPAENDALRREALIKRAIAGGPEPASENMLATAQPNPSKANEPTPSNDPIDRSHLARYTLSNPILEREILGLFVAQLPLTLEQLSYASTARAWHEAAHTLKGSARAVGAWHIAALAQDAEMIDASVDADARRGILARIEGAVLDVDSYMERTFPTHVAAE